MRIRKPTHSRNKARRISPLAGVDYAALSRKAKFVGSPVHKSVHTWLGNPQLIPKANRSICPEQWRTEKDRKMLEKQLKKAINDGKVSAMHLGGFPKQVWCRIEGRVYEGFLIEQGQGTYKGYPLDQEECPPGL
ncbi:MAG: hypothetical protein KIS67_28145 [Verrucomicrobiae bacterium]|nr:hypothetical protein [Verrucomicrobiae bacterium]MCW5898993.1 hypothetical protein [Flavobacteriales bacterium]